MPPAGAAAVVADLLRLLANTRSVLGTTGQPWQGQRDAYLGWVEDAERRLRGLSDDEPTVALHTERYWKIRDLTEASVRPADLVHAEIDAQHARLSAVAARLPASPTGLGGEVGSGVCAVFDTNVHLHFPRFDQHDWAGELGGPVVVVVPLVVLEELDRRKNQGTPVLSDRAAGVTRKIEDLVEEHGGRVHDRLSVVLVPETDGHVRRETVDAEIVAVASDLASRPGWRVVVVTDDAGLRAQARARGLDVHRPGAERLPATDPAAARLRRDQHEVDKILVARPDAKVTFADGEPRLLLPPGPETTTQDGFVASVVNGAGQDRPALGIPKPPQGVLGVSGLNWDVMPGAGANRRYNEQREAWLRAIADWAAKEYGRLVRKRNAVDLGLCGRNSGGAAAQDVEVRVELPEGDRSVYLRADSVEAAEDRPDPPEHSPYGTHLSRRMISQVRSKMDVRPVWRWKVDAEAHTAVLHVDRVLQGDLPRPFGPTLLLVPRTGTLVRPVSLRWSLTGANPAYSRTGTLTVMPGTQVLEG